METEAGDTFRYVVTYRKHAMLFLSIFFPVDWSYHLHLYTETDRGILYFINKQTLQPIIRVSLFWLTVLTTKKFYSCWHRYTQYKSIYSQTHNLGTLFLGLQRLERTSVTEWLLRRSLCERTYQYICVHQNMHRSFALKKLGVI